MVKQKISSQSPKDKNKHSANTISTKTVYSALLKNVFLQNISLRTLNTYLFPANTIPLMNASTICTSVVVQCDNEINFNNANCQTEQ